MIRWRPATGLNVRTPFSQHLPANVAQELVTIPDIEVSDLRNAVIFDLFLLPDPDGPDPHRKLLPSLRELYLRYTAPVVHDNRGPWPTEPTAVVTSQKGEGAHICPQA
jgi:hypothetical protein